MVSVFYWSAHRLGSTIVFTEKRTFSFSIIEKVNVTFIMSSNSIDSKVTWTNYHCWMRQKRNIFTMMDEIFLPVWSATKIFRLIRSQQMVVYLSVLIRKKHHRWCYFDYYSAYSKKSNSNIDRYTLWGGQILKLDKHTQSDQRFNAQNVWLFSHTIFLFSLILPFPFQAIYFCH